MLNGLETKRQERKFGILEMVFRHLIQVKFVIARPTRQFDVTFCAALSDEKILHRGDAFPEVLGVEDKFCEAVARHTHE